MKNSKQILILAIVVVLGVLVWMFYIKGNQPSVDDNNVSPVAEDNGKYIPELNSNLETTVTVVNPNAVVDGANKVK